MIIDHIRDMEEFKALYNERPMPMPYDFEWLIKNPCLYCFYDEGKLLGFITIQREDGELTLSGVSIRKNMPNIITAIVTVCEAFNENTYSYTPLKHAGLVLKKAGFKHLKDDKYVRYKNG
jgi:hypothetical protein